MPNPKSKWVSDISATPDKDKPPAPSKIGRDGHNKIVAPPKHVTTPFGKLHSNKLLDRNFHTNDDLFIAGSRYYSDWYLSGLNPVSAMSYDRVGGAGSSPGFMPASELQAERRWAWRSAKEAMGRRYEEVVDAIVLEGRSVTDAGKTIGYTHRHSAAAAGMERLVEGLFRLAKHYGIIKRI